MSRYILQPERFAHPEKHWIVIGWDRAMRTYFAQIQDRAIVAALDAEDRELSRCIAEGLPLPESSVGDHSKIIAWLGDEHGQYPDIDGFLEALAPYTSLAPGLRAILIADQQGGKS